MKSSQKPSVLIPHRLTENLYVTEFVSAYGKLGWNVVTGAGRFWEDTDGISVVHIHWPEEIYRWTTRNPPEQEAARTIERLRELRQRGVTIVWTVHNLAPHEFTNDPIDRGVYAAMVELADVIAHHCPRSIQALEAHYGKPPRATQIVVPHGHYFGYPQGIGREAARRQLGIAEDESVFLSFGIIRAYKGLQFILDAFARMPLGRKRLLIAGRFQPAGRRKSLAERWFLAKLRFLTPGVSLFTGVVPTEDVQVYMEASDVVVLGHSRGLNSGLVPLGMTFGKVVVGPDIGCIGWTLRQGVNMVYAPGDVQALSDAMAKAASTEISGVAKQNIDTARGWDWEVGARNILAAARLDFGHVGEG